MTNTTDAAYGTLHDYNTGEELRPATDDEAKLSREADADGGTGVIEVDGRSCYVLDW